MWTAPLRKKYNGSACEDDKREYKTYGNDKSVWNTKDQQIMLFKILFKTNNGSNGVCCRRIID